MIICSFYEETQARRKPLRILSSSICLVLSVSPACAAGTNLVQPLATSSAKLPFGNGQVAGITGLFFPTLPAVSGPTSSWSLTQWNHVDYLNPSLMVTLPNAGNPVYAFVAADKTSSLIITHQASEPGYVFSLFNSNGTLSNGGGRALYLSTNVYPGASATLDHNTNLSIDVRVGLAQVTYTYPTAQRTGAVLAMSYIGGGFMFTDPVTKHQQFVFFQIDLSMSAPPHLTPGYMCSKGTVSLYGVPAPAGQALPFKTDTGPLHHFGYSLSGTLKAMLSNANPCGTPWTAHQLVPANWSFTGTYIGSETENTDTRPGAATSQPQGSAGIDLDIANVSITRQ